MPEPGKKKDTNYPYLNHLLLMEGALGTAASDSILKIVFNTLFPL